MPRDQSEEVPRTARMILGQMVATPLTGRTMGSPKSDFVIAEWTDPGGPLGPPRLIAPLHVHDRDDEAWYVLEGTLKFKLGDREVDAPKGSGVFGPRGVSHTFWNPGPDPARYLLIMTANTSRLLEEVHSLTGRDPDRVEKVFRKYNCRILG